MNTPTKEGKDGTRSLARARRRSVTMAFESFDWDIEGVDLEASLMPLLDPRPEEIKARPQACD